jgi:small subunit ribosomal protein S12
MMGAPQRRATVLRIFVIDPRKPNSAKRKCVRFRFPNGFEATAYLPGERVRVQEHSTVLIVPGRSPDLPGVKYRVVPGVYDASNDPTRRQRRSKHGIKKA